MRYVSNLTAPDLAPCFKLLHPPKQIMGHDAPSDPDYEPDCCYFTHDEAAILYNVARSVRGTWIDIGARFGWTGAHLAAAGALLVLVDPEQEDLERRARLKRNMAPWWDNVVTVLPRLHCGDLQADGFVIDGCHDSPEPWRDAERCLAIANPDCVIVLHDFYGKPVRDAVRFLINSGFHCRVYWTPNGIAVCWRGFNLGRLNAGEQAGLWKPPVHEADPQIDWKLRRHQMKKDFDFGVCV